MHRYLVILQSWTLALYGGANWRQKMHINFDQAENLEMFLAAEFVNETRVPFTLSNDSYDVGYKILDAVSCDFALDSGFLDLDDLS
jgi:hypothetical protein